MGEVRVQSVTTVGAVASKFDERWLLSAGAGPRVSLSGRGIPRCTGVRSRPEKVTPRCGDVGWSTGVCGCSRRPPLGAHNEQIRIEMHAQLKCVKREEVRVQADIAVGAEASKFD